MNLGWITDTVTTDASRAVHYTLLWGLDGIVLRTVGTPGNRVPGINEAPLRRRLEGEELPVFAIDPGLFEGGLSERARWMNEVDAFDEVGSFCKRFGTGLVLVGALACETEDFDEGQAADALRRLGIAAARFGLELGVRNEMSTAIPTGRALASLLKRVGHPAVRADWRPLDALRAGEDPLDGLAAVREWLASVTVRDETQDGEAAIPGQGQIDWDGLVGPLKADGWTGVTILEMHGRPAGPFGLHTASAMISAIRRAKRAAAS